MAERYLLPQVQQDLARKMVFVAGPRQVGKTTLALSLPGAAEGYLSWDISEHRERILRRELPDLKIVGLDAPRINVDSISEDVLSRIRDAKPDLVLVALGAPKQEIFSHEQREALKPAVLLGIGASLDFIAGSRRRAPRWVSSAGLEWLYRLAQEPRRLAGRYLLRDPQFLWIVGRQLAKGQSTPKS